MKTDRLIFSVYVEHKLRPASLNDPFQEKCMSLPCERCNVLLLVCASAKNQSRAEKQS